jgi:DNA-binding CsgD family transcriptional regulator/PAS domain-containing protein
VKRGRASHEFTSIVEGLYDAAIGSGSWLRATGALVDTVKAVGAVTVRIDPWGKSLPLSESLAGSYESYIHDGWWQRDERARAVPLLARRTVVVDLDLFSAAEIARMPFYQEFLAPHGLRWAAMVGMRVEGAPWSFSLQRTIRQEPFDAHEQLQLAQFAPHLSRALTLQSALERSWTEGLISALDAVQCPAFLIDGGGRVTRHNRAAETLVGHGLEIVSGHLRAESHGDGVELDALIRGVVGAVTEADAPLHVVTLGRTERPPLLARAIPLRRECELWFGHARALLLLSEVGSRLQGVADLVRRHHGLTGNEAAMAAWLSEGRSIEAFADTRQLATASARQIAKQALAKTGTHRQSELVALVKNLQAALARIGA